jgi:hypothetical protein
MLAEATLPTEDGEEEVEAKVHFEVCPTCEGRGKYVNPNVDREGLTADDFSEDPDFAENYHSGLYDVGCVHCQGQRVVPVADDAAIRERIENHVNEQLAYRCECAAERGF